MIEHEFRDALVARIDSHYMEPAARMVHELAIPQHRARVDVAVIERHMVGFEIKTGNDTLSRLGSQERAYSKVFDRMYLVS